MAENSKIKYSHRFLARIVIEAETPLAVRSGEKGVLTDALVALDSNGLPYIPATSLAGVFRSFFRILTPGPTDDSEKKDKESAVQYERLFGNTDYGSEIIFTEAKIIDSEGKVIDGRNLIADMSADPLLQNYIELPVRQHVRLSDKGVAGNKGKFDEQVVYAGTRFCFEVEMISYGQNFKEFEAVLCSLFDGSFHIGGGSRSGFGKIGVFSVQYVDLDLTKADDLDKYLKKSSALNTDFWKNYPNRKDELCEQKTQSSNFFVLELELKPESFFLFGSGFGDDEVDMTPVKAKKVEWTDDKKSMHMHGKMQENLVLIPASPLKGAIAHRVAFHWNRLNGVFADKLTAKEIAEATGKNNAAVRILFGSEGDGNGAGITRGNVVFSDIIEKPLADKIFNHVAIDRFTGGAIAGALFNEKATYGLGQNYHTKILLDLDGIDKACKKAFKNGLERNTAEKYNDYRQKVIDAFKATLDDLCSGMLPLGGRVNKGYGVFTGEYKPKSICIIDGDNK